MSGGLLHLSPVESVRYATELFDNGKDGGQPSTFKARLRGCNTYITKQTGRAHYEIHKTRVPFAEANSSSSAKTKCVKTGKKEREKEKRKEKRKKKKKKKKKKNDLSV